MPLWDLPGGPAVRLLPVQKTRVWSLVGGDSTCLGATKPASQNYWAQALKQEKPRQAEKAHVQQPRPSAAKNK